VPIVISSPLDKLYEKFPVVIVKDWSDAFKEGALERYKSDILRRFGENPFDSSIIHKLTANYWVNLIHNEAKEMYTN